MKNTSVVVSHNYNIGDIFKFFYTYGGWKITTQLTKDLCILYIM